MDYLSKIQTFFKSVERL